MMPFWKMENIIFIISNIFIIFLLLFIVFWQRDKQVWAHYQTNGIYMWSGRFRLKLVHCGMFFFLLIINISFVKKSGLKKKVWIVDLFRPYGSHLQRYHSAKVIITGGNGCML